MHLVLVVENVLSAALMSVLVMLSSGLLRSNTAMKNMPEGSRDRQDFAAYMREFDPNDFSSELSLSFVFIASAYPACHNGPSNPP